VVEHHHGLVAPLGPRRGEHLEPEAEVLAGEDADDEVDQHAEHAEQLAHLADPRRLVRPRGEPEPGDDAPGERHHGQRPQVGRLRGPAHREGEQHRQPGERHQGEPQDADQRLGEEHAPRLDR
jgi:hypothetical protein